MQFFCIYYYCGCFTNSSKGLNEGFVCWLPAASYSAYIIKVTPVFCLLEYCSEHTCTECWLFTDYCITAYDYNKVFLKACGWKWGVYSYLMTP